MILSGAMKTVDSKLTSFLVLTTLTLGFTQSTYAQSSAKKKSDAEYWRETGLTVKVFENNTAPLCMKSEKNFLGCMSGINRLAIALPEPEIITTDEEKSLGSPGLGDKIANLGGGLAIYSLKQLHLKDAKEARSESRKMRDAHLKALHKLYQTKSNIPFTDIIDALMKQLLVGEHKNDEAFFASHLFNGYYEAAYDPHTYLVSTAEKKERMEHAGRQYGGLGIGIALSKDKKNILVTTVYEGGPAERAGLKWNDVIQKINGKDVSSIKEELRTKSLTGEAGTTVALEIVRNQEVMEIEVTRATIHIPNVRSKIVHHLGTKIGLISLDSFMDQNAAPAVQHAIQELTLQGATGLILDLRNNGGGLVDVAVDIASLFMGKQKIVQMQSIATKQTYDYMGRMDAITDLPLVTLINSYSASASELLSGAFQDYQRSWVVGDRSFGKGSAQSSKTWRMKDFNPAGKIQIMSTDIVYFLPTGRSPQIAGVTPDFLVTPTPELKFEDIFVQREEDLYSNALPAKTKPWEQPRANQVSQIHQCRSIQHKAEAMYQNPDESFTNAPDYQLLVAEEILGCI